MRWEVIAGLSAMLRTGCRGTSMQAGRPALEAGVGRMVPSPVYALIPGTCEYVTLQGQRNFAGAIKVIDFKTERLSWLSSWA